MEQKNGNYHIGGLYRENGKQNGLYYLGFRVKGLPVSTSDAVQLKSAYAARALGRGSPAPHSCRKPWPDKKLAHGGQLSWRDYLGH